MGGKDSSAAYDKFEIYNISTDSWITKTDIPTPREALSQVQIV